MEIIAKKKHLLNTTQLQKFQTFNEIKDEFHIVTLNIYRDEFEQLLNNIFIIDLSDSSSVTHGFEVLSYFGCNLEPFMIQLTKHITSQENKRIEAFFGRHIDKIYWNWLSEDENLSEAFFEKHIDKVNWNWLSYNSN